MITWNGRHSAELRVFVEKYPPRPIPQRKNQRYSVPGRSGDVIVQEDAWENVVQKYEIYLSAEQPGLPFVAANAVRWLMQRGYCRLEDEYDIEHFRLAQFCGPVDLENTLNQFGRATIEFDCKPQRFLKNGDVPITLDSSGAALHNPTGYTALPEILLFGGGAATLTVGDRTLTLNVTNGMVLDCEEGEAYTYKNGAYVNLNLAVSGEYPALGEGDTAISWTGGIASVQITPRWYVL